MNIPSASQLLASYDTYHVQLLYQRVGTDLWGNPWELQFWEGDLKACEEGVALFMAIHKGIEPDLYESKVEGVDIVRNQNVINGSSWGGKLNRSKKNARNHFEKRWLIQYQIERIKRGTKPCQEDRSWQGE